MRGLDSLERSGPRFVAWFVISLDTLCSSIAASTPRSSVQPSCSQRASPARRWANTRIFRSYLSAYPRGRQRQGAYYILIRALRAQGRSAEARQMIERYLTDYPNGRYRDSLMPTASEPQRQTADGGGDS